MSHVEDATTRPISTHDHEITRGGSDTGHPHRPIIPHTIRIFAVPIILAWVVLTVIVNVAVPRLEVVSEDIPRR